ncbi:MAG: XdhC family protein [Anaerolineae bacterium]|nr:XdhC family protein [Anaerolineae bacterium]
MRDIIHDIRKWQLAGETKIALATIVETRGSSLRPSGTRMAINSEGDITGSVSSGCVDGDAVAEMETVLQGESTIQRPFFGISDELAWGAGLSCGGSIDVLVEMWHPIFDTLIEEIDNRRTVAFASRLDKPLHLLHKANGQTLGSLEDPDLDGAVLMDIAAAWPLPHAHKHQYPQAEVFIEIIPPPPTLLIFGATDIAAPLAKLAAAIDFNVIISDARRAFLREERFPDCKIRYGWPQDVFTPRDIGSEWAVIVLFHDPKFDVPALSLALKSQAFYIGFLGSKTTQHDRRAQLVADGFKESELDKIYGPVGLNIGGKTPGMIALSILSEVVAVWNRREGGMMSKKG